jgi:hypothetical protein
MKSMNRYPVRFAAGTTVALAVLASAAAAVHPAAAASAFAVVEGVVTCATSAACVAGTNTAAGPGVAGISSSGAGVSAKSTKGNGVLASSSTSAGIDATSTSSYGVEGVSSKSYGVWGTTQTGTSGVGGTTSSSTGDGVYGYTASGGNGVAGSSSSGKGVLGTASTGIGVYGSSSSGSFGIYGTTGNGYGTAVNGYVSGSGVGVSGYSASGNGVNGSTSTGTGVYASSGSGDGIYTYSTSGTALDAETYGSRAIIATNHNGDGSDISGTYIGMIGRAPASGGYPLLLTDQNGQDLFFVDGAGNVFYSGSLNTFARTSGGGTVNSYAPQTAVPTVEDYGTAQLVAGAAAVRLDPTFASSIDPNAGYRVFITPSGDTRGLFVPTKTAAGFIVRETQGGHSTLSFDYRVVATPLGAAGKRMAYVSRANGPHAPLPSSSPPQHGPTTQKPLP